MRKPTRAELEETLKRWQAVLGGDGVRTRVTPRPPSSPPECLGCHDDDRPPYFRPRAPHEGACLRFELSQPCIEERQRRSHWTPAAAVETKLLDLPEEPFDFLEPGCVRSAGGIAPAVARHRGKHFPRRVWRWLARFTKRSTPGTNL
jgi:hypothetical protein